VCFLKIRVYSLVCLAKQLQRADIISCSFTTRKIELNNLWKVFLTDKADLVRWIFYYLTLTVHVPEGYSSNLVCWSVVLSICYSVDLNIGSQWSLGSKPWVKYQIKIGDILRGNEKKTFSSFGLIFKKKRLNSDYGAMPKAPPPLYYLVSIVA